MKITLLQTDIIWGQPEANLAHLDHLLEGVGECDLIVLPEMFTTGFDTNPETVADDEGLALKWMRNTVRQRNCALAGSVATKVGENYYNRLYFVSPYPCWLLTTSIISSPTAMSRRPLRRATVAS